jgi:hypothetical protein
MHKSKGNDEIYYIGFIARLKKKKILSLYSSKKFDYSLGATPIGSAGHAPDEDENIGSNAGVKIDFIIGGKHLIINSTFHSHREGFVTS